MSFHSFSHYSNILRWTHSHTTDTSISYNDVGDNNTKMSFDTIPHSHGSALFWGENKRYFYFTTFPKSKNCTTYQLEKRKRKKKHIKNIWSICSLYIIIWYDCSWFILRPCNWSWMSKSWKCPCHSHLDFVSSVFVIFCTLVRCSICSNNNKKLWKCWLLLKYI